MLFLFNETYMDGESQSTFHVRFQKEKMKVVKADIEDQEFQKQVELTGRALTEVANLNYSGSLMSNQNCQTPQTDLAAVV